VVVQAFVPKLGFELSQHRAEGRSTETENIQGIPPRREYVIANVCDWIADPAADESK